MSGGVHGAEVPWFGCRSVRWHCFTCDLLFLLPVQAARRTWVEVQEALEAHQWVGSEALVVVAAHLDLVGNRRQVNASVVEIAIVIVTATEIESAPGGRGRGTGIGNVDLTGTGAAPCGPPFVNSISSVCNACA
jgi:hypothetical protein